MTIPIIIPAYEPDERLLTLLKALNIQKVDPIIIVNDGSNNKYDYIFEEAKNKFNATILIHETNKGKGQALKTAFAHVLKNYPDLVGCITADSDGQHSPESIIKCKNELLKNPNSLILGTRDFSNENVPPKSKFGNNLTKKIFKFLYKTSISDTQTGLRCIPKSFLKTCLEIQGDRFEYEIRMLIKAVELKIEIKETQIETIYDSKENHSTHFRPVVDSLRIYKCFGFAFGKFLLSSLSSSVIDLGLFQLFCFLAKNLSLAFSYIALSTIAARIISASYNYSINYFFVFKSKKKHLSTAIKYIILALIQMSLSALLTTILASIANPSIELFIKLPVDVFLFIISFIIQKKIIY